MTNSHRLRKPISLIVACSFFCAPMAHADPEMAGGAKAASATDSDRAKCQREMKEQDCEKFFTDNQTYEGYRRVCTADAPDLRYLPETLAYCVGQAGVIAKELAYALTVAPVEAVRTQLAINAKETEIQKAINEACYQDPECRKVLHQRTGKLIIQNGREKWLLHEDEVEDFKKKPLGELLALQQSHWQPFYDRGDQHGYACHLKKTGYPFTHEELEHVDGVLQGRIARSVSEYEKQGLRERFARDCPVPEMPPRESPVSASVLERAKKYLGNQVKCLNYEGLTVAGCYATIFGATMFVGVGAPSGALMTALKAPGRLVKKAMSAAKLTRPAGAGAMTDARFAEFSTALSGNKSFASLPAYQKPEAMHALQNAVGATAAGGANASDSLIRALAYQPGPLSQVKEAVLKTQGLKPAERARISAAFDSAGAKVEGIRKRYGEAIAASGEDPGEIYSLIAAAEARGVPASKIEAAMNTSCTIR